MFTRKVLVFAIGGGFLLSLLGCGSQSEGGRSEVSGETSSIADFQDEYSDSDSNGLIEHLAGGRLRFIGDLRKVSTLPIELGVKLGVSVLNIGLTGSASFDFISTSTVVLSKKVRDEASRIFIKSKREVCSRLII
jgi:hypothetical protein